MGYVGEYIILYAMHLVQSCIHGMYEEVGLSLLAGVCVLFTTSMTTLLF